MNGLDLFSGIAGNTLGLREYVNTIAYCEQDRHAQSVLLSRMEQKLLKPAPIWDDITTLKGNMFDVPIDIIIGGFPCQDISVAGRGKGLAGERSGLFFEVCRLVEEIKPSFVFLENVPAIRTRGLREVVRALTDLGYDCRWTCVSAAEVGAHHIRKRWFLLAHTQGSDGRGVLRELLEANEGQSRPKKQYENETGEPFDASEDTEFLAHARRKYDQSQPGSIQKASRAAQQQERGQRPIGGGIRQPATGPTNLRTGWEVEPNVDRVVNGLPLRVDRIKRLGNAVVPLQAKVAFEKLMGIK